MVENDVFALIDLFSYTCVYYVESDKYLENRVLVDVSFECNVTTLVWTRTSVDNYFTDETGSESIVTILGHLWPSEAPLSSK